LIADNVCHGAVVLLACANVAQCADAGLGQELAQSVGDIAARKDGALEAQQHRGEALGGRQQRALLGLLGVAADVGQRHGQRLLLALLLDQLLGGLEEQRNHVVLHRAQQMQRRCSADLDQLVGLRRANARERDADLLFQVLERAHVALREERDCRSGSAGSTGSTRAMDIGLGVAWWLALNDQIDARDVETACRHVGGNQAAEGALLEVAHGQFALVLCNITMKQLTIYAKSSNHSSIINKPRETERE
jgi:hypothetical protein